MNVRCGPPGLGYLIPWPLLLPRRRGTRTAENKRGAVTRWRLSCSSKANSCRIHEAWLVVENCFARQHARPCSGLNPWIDHRGDYMSAENKALVTELFEGINKGDLSVFDALPDDFIEHE